MELKDILLKKGDIVYFEDGDKMVVDKLSDSKASKAFIIKIIKIERPIKYETIYEAPKQILTQEEKEYLEAVIRPFKDRVLFISKHLCFNRPYEWLKIKLKDEELDTEDLDLPNFKEHTMYKGMELTKEYTLKELGLFEGE